MRRGKDQIRKSKGRQEVNFKPPLTRKKKGRGGDRKTGPHPKPSTATFRGGGRRGAECIPYMGGTCRAKDRKKGEGDSEGGKG